MSKNGKTATALTTILASRFRDVLAPSEYTVTATGLALTVQDARSPRCVTCTPALGLLSSGIERDKFRSACEIAARSIVNFVAPGVSLHVDVSGRNVLVWWSSGTQTVRLSPINWTDLCM